MRILPILLFLSLFFSVCAEQSPTDDLLNVAATEGMPSSLVNGSVCAITGAYVDSSVDFVLEGPEKLVLERFYCSHRIPANLCTSWSINHADYITSEIVLMDGGDKHAYLFNVKQSSGSTIQYYQKYKPKKQPFNFCPTIVFPFGLTNTRHCEISGRTNLKNRQIAMTLKSPTTGCLITSGDGEQQFFRQVKSKTKKSNMSEYMRKSCNGIQTIYDLREDGNFSSFKKVTPDGQLYCWTNATGGDCANGDSYMAISTSSDQKITYRFTKFKYKVKGNGTNSSAYLRYLSEVDRTSGPTESYSYSEKNRTPYLYQISSRRRPEDRYLSISYYHKGQNESPAIKVDTTNDWLLDRVKNLWAPVGSDKTPIKTHTFSYHAWHNADKFCLGGVTSVYDAYSVKTAYHYDFQQRLLILEKCNKAGQSYSAEFFVWGADTGPNWGNLIGTALRDQNGKIIKAKRLEYDERGNVSIETLFGNLTGSHAADMAVGSDQLPAYGTGEAYSKWFNYSADGLNLLLYSREHNGKEVHYSYKSGTNLLISKIEFDKGLINKRTFCEYDKNGSLILKMIDDGASLIKEDLTGVTQRLITRYWLRPTEPVGVPERIDELYLDLGTGQEMLIKRAHSCYSMDGKMVKQDVYGSDWQYDHTLLWSYDRHGNLLSHTNALGETTTYRYDANDNRTSEQDAAHVTTFSYDCSNRLVKEETVYWDGITQTTHHSYDYLHNRISTVDPFGCETRYEYDEFCRKIKVIHPSVPNKAGQLVTPTELFSYDVLGNVTSHTSSRGAITSTKHNVRSQPALINHPDGTQEQFVYNGDGTLNLKVSKNGTETRYTYDGFGNVIVEEDFATSGESLRKTTAVYSAFHVLSTTDAEGLVTNYSYDGAGRLIAEISGDRKTTYEYDSMGRVFKKYEWLSSEEAKVTITLYDKRDRVIEERIEDLQGNTLRKSLYQNDFYDNICRSEEGESITYYFHDGLNRLFKTIDPLGNITESVYNNAFINAYNQRVIQQTETDPLGNQTLITSDTHGRIASIAKRDPMGKLTFHQELRYDADGNECITIDHVIVEGQDIRQIITRKEYDLGGQLTEQIEAEGTPEEKITRYIYNKSGELERLIKSDGVVLTHSYDLLGRLKEFKSSDGTINYAYSYDLNDHVISANDNINHLNTLCEYDDQGRLIQETLGHGATVYYSYDPFDRVTSMEVQDKNIFYEYDLLDLKAVAWRGSRHEIISRNLKGQPTEISLINGTIGTYSYDLLGQCLSISHPAFNQTATYDPIGNILTTQINRESKTFQYDSLSQLTAEENNDYDYDSVGNRLRHNDDEHDYNALNQMIDPGYRYDPNGNLSADKTATYTYDALDRLISVTTPTKTIEYRYDSFDRRLIRRVGDSEEHFLYQNQEEIGSLQDGVLRDFRVLGECSHAIAIMQDETTYAPLYDLTNNVICLTNNLGSAVEQYDYSVFKEESSLETLNPWRYAGKRTDAETGFVYFGKRYYSPILGRWITSDPLGYADGPNLYAYVHNNPLRFYDPEGLFASEIRDYAINTYNHPRFQGAMQAVGGLGEMGIGGGMTYASGGLAAPAGFAVFTHGADNFFTGMKTAITGQYHDTVTSQLLQKTGMSSHTANLVDNSIGLFGSMGGAALIQSSRALAQTPFKTLPAAQKTTNAPVKYGMPCLDKLSKAGQVMDRGGLTKAGRALDKHGNRLNSPFPKAIGNSASKNRQGQFHLDDILTHPNIKMIRGDKGDTRLYAPDGRGAHFRLDNSFKGFLDYE